MTLKQKRIFWFTIWLLVLLSGPFTVLKNTDLSTAISSDLLFVNLFQRLTGVVAFTLIFIQITLGSLMERWIKILGAKAFRAHVTEGIITYTFIFIHPLMQMYFDYSARGSFGALLTLFPGRDIYLNLGKVGFLLLTVGVIAGYFRTKPIFRRNWRTLHILNYIAFFFIFIHSRNLGSDVNSLPFAILHKSSVFIVALIISYKLYLKLSSKFARAKVVEG